MTVIAFAGPSLPAADRLRYRGVDWRPPVKAGDLLRLDAGTSPTLCLIDGYFDHRPAVRHKEILLLLAEGVRIFGASSIGALRAAEMREFGMVGVGAIYRAYARGSIRGDDEVALVHAAADRDWRPLSIPLVDVRATLCRARRERILNQSETRALLNAARHVHYIERDWSSVVSASGIAEAAAFERWLKSGAVARKRLDAEACVRAALEDRPAERERPRLVRTAFLDALARECGVDLDSRRAALGSDS